MKTNKVEIATRSARALVVWSLAALLVAALAAPASAQRRGKSRAGGGGAAFTKIAAQATEARTAGRFDEAIDLYRRGVGMNASWDEGWWFLGTLLYERDAYDEAANAFAHAAKLRPKVGTPWVMLGLCEYRLGMFDAAGEHIFKGHKLGFGQNDELMRVVVYHEGVLGLYKGEFEAAQKRLDDLAFVGVRSENLIVALGLAVLRIPALPDRIDVNAPDFPLVRQAGWAEYQLAQNNMQDAQREYDRLVANYGDRPNVQYAYGRFQLIARNDEGALAAFKKEIENDPNSALARIQIAYIMLNRNEPAEGVPFAEEAVRLYPRYAQGHFLFGRLLFDTGENERAIQELETARQLAPDEPRIYYALARAYDKAKRKDDARVARETFVKLTKAADEASRAPGVRNVPEGVAVPAVPDENQ